MKNYGGDLADIIRTGGIINPDISDHYDQDFDHNPVGLEEEDPLDEFGDPFSLLLQDPLTTGAVDDGGCSGLFNNAAVVLSNYSIDNQSGFINGDENQSVIHGQKLLSDDHQEESLIRRRPGINFLTQMLQISPTTTKLSDSTDHIRDSPEVGASVKKKKKITPTMLAVNDMMLSNSKGENAGLQISSPRNAGIKRRKSQARKVVCIPAPAPVNSRPSGEVVPSDLWAWRKYGQKPIKGSPYPRGYYRCSSSKGCPARKQVERSRSDPNMLVITYTCDHNHPWPTQRNALAGSTRNTTHPVTKTGSSRYSKTSSSHQSHKPPVVPATTVLFKEEDQMEDIITTSTAIQSQLLPYNNNNNNNNEDNDYMITVAPSLIKEETLMEDYKPAGIIFPELSLSNLHTEDFFAELGELESDPMNLLFPNGYSDLDHDGENKSLDPFTFYDWAGNNNNNIHDLDKGSSQLGFNN